MDIIVVSETLPLFIDDDMTKAFNRLAICESPEADPQPEHEPTNYVIIPGQRYQHYLKVPESLKGLGISQRQYHTIPSLMKRDPDVIILCPIHAKYKLMTKFSEFNDEVRDMIIPRCVFYDTLDFSLIENIRIAEKIDTISSSFVKRIKRIHSRSGRDINVESIIDSVRNELEIECEDDSGYDDNSIIYEDVVIVDKKKRRRL